MGCFSTGEGLLSTALDTASMGCYLVLSCFNFEKEIGSDGRVGKHSSSNITSR